MVSRSAGDAGWPDSVEVRLLGNLRIRDARGDVVDLARFRTRKTLDLLRLLALRVGEPVAGSVLVQRLWPDVPEQKGRASLRTAASTIRGVLGAAHLERRLDGLTLCGTWVDTVAFTNLVVSSRIDLREGRPAQAVVAAREAEALYLHDFRADDDSASWVVTERNQLRAMYGRLLEDTAEAALVLGWHRDVEDFASRAILRDPFAERPVRALMTAFAATGQLERALRVFHTCRTALADELGVDPSEQTQALHLAILRGDVPTAEPHEVPLVGRDRELARLVGLIRAGTRDSRRDVVELRGAPGCGPLRLLDAACREVGVGWTRRPAPRGNGPQVLVESAESFLRQDPGGPGAVEDGPGTVLVLTASAMDPVMRPAAQERGWRWFGIELGPLDAPSSARLAEAAFGGAASEDLLGVVVDSAGGAPERILGEARQLLRAGRVVSTTEGLALAPEVSGSNGSIDAATVVARAMDLLPAESHELLHVLAMADAPLRLEALLTLVADAGPDEVRRSLSLLVDTSVLVREEDAYSFRHRVVAIAVRSWLRPSARTALRSRILAATTTGDQDAAAQDAVGSSAVSSSAVRVPVVSTGSRLVQPWQVARELGVMPGTRPEAAEKTLRQAATTQTSSLQEAPTSDAGDRLAVIILLLAERSFIPARRLDDLQAVLAEVPVRTRRTDLLAEADVLGLLPLVLLGHAATVRHRIEAAARAPDRPSSVVTRLRRLAVLAEHDLGVAGLDPAQGVDARAGHEWRFLPLRLLVERRGLELPRQQRPDDTMAGTPLLRQLQAVAAADRDESTRHADPVERVLRAAADDAVESGCTLMLPEIAARLVILGCTADPAQAQLDFDLLDDGVGDGVQHPRELYLRHLARAHVRASRGDCRGAAASAATAGSVARRHGLLPLVHEARRLRDRWRQEVGRGRLRSSAPVAPPPQPGQGLRTLATTVPVRLDAGTEPKSRESTDTSRESPRTNTAPVGTE